MTDSPGRGHPSYRNPRHRPQMLLEARAPFELGQLLALSPAMRMAPRGDGRPVLVLPGLAAGDLSTRPLRAYLRGQGHHVHRWKLGRNEGPTARVIRGLASRLAEVVEAHDGTPIALVGWSLGGVYALGLGRALPGRIRRIVTLGSPLAALDDPSVARHRLGEALRDRLGPAEGPLPPLTSIWSRTDAIVPWRASMVGEHGDPLAEDIEVHASHLGIGWSPAALYAVADRLALPDGELPPFAPPRGLSAAYPDPRRHGAA